MNHCDGDATMSNKRLIYDEYDPWATYDPSPVFVRRTPKRIRNRKPTLASVAKQAAKVGIDVARYEVDPNGKIIIITGKSVAAEMTGTDANIGETSADLRRLL
jgi:hypothetical protein